METLKHYRKFIKVCRKLKDYNNRSYFLRITRENFRGNTYDLNKAAKDIEVLERQTVLQALYPPQKSIIETLNIPEKLGYYHKTGK